MFFLPFFLFQIFCVNIQDLKFSYVTYFYVDLTQHNSFIFFDVFLFIKKHGKNIGKNMEKNIEKNIWKKHGKKIIGKNMGKTNIIKQEIKNIKNN